MDLMGYEKLGDVSVSGMTGAVDKDGNKATVLRVRIPSRRAAELGIKQGIRGVSNIELMVSPSLAIAIETGKFDLIYRFDLERMKTLENKYLEEHPSVKPRKTTPEITGDKDDYNIDEFLGKEQNGTE